MRFAAQRLATVDGVPVRVELDAPGRPPPAAGTYVLRATSFDVFRLRLGRRSVEQVRAMRWSVDPAPILTRLFLFGPATVAIEG